MKTTILEDTAELGIVEISAIKDEEKEKESSIKPSSKEEIGQCLSPYIHYPFGKPIGIAVRHQ